jgi:hypothetical protein
MLLRRIFQLLFMSRARRESIRIGLLRQLHARATLYPGPPAVILARTAVRSRHDLTIDPFETEFRLERDQVSVRAWLTLSPQDVPEDMLGSITTAAEGLAGLSHEVRQTYFLSTSYRLKIAEISAMFGTSRWKVRHDLITAIARLDGRRM